MVYFPAPLEKLVEQFARLPGIGGKSAQRLAFHVLGLPEEEAKEFADAILEAKRGVTSARCVRTSLLAVCAPSAPPPSGTAPPSAWWQTPEMWWPLSAVGSITDIIMSSMASSLP